MCEDDANERSAAFFRISFALLSAVTSLRSRINSSSRGRPCPGKGGKPVPATPRACCIHRYSSFSLIPQSAATWHTGFSCFSASDTASALNSFGYTRRSLSCFPIVVSSSVIFFACLCVYLLGAGPPRVRPRYRCIRGRYRCIRGRYHCIRGRYHCIRGGYRCIRPRYRRFRAQNT